MAEDKKRSGTRVSVQDAMGFYHSVPIEDLEEFQAYQQKLIESGDPEAPLRAWLEKYEHRYKDKK